MEATVIQGSPHRGHGKAYVACDPSEGHTAMLALEWLASQTQANPKLRVKIFYDDQSRTGIKIENPNYSPGEYANLHELAELAAYINANK